MQDPLYREIILEHWQHPQNYGVVPDATKDVTEFNPLCGDEIRLTLKIEQGRITKIAFTSQGCAISKASASLFTEKIKQKEVEQVKQYIPENVLEELDIDLTPARLKCALLIFSALKKALK